MRSTERSTVFERALSLGRSIFATAGRTSLQLAAAGIAFFATLSLFPALAAVVALYGIWADPQIIPQHLGMLQTILPPDAYALVEEEITRLLGSDETRHGTALIIWLLLALWTARAGVNGLITGLDQVNPDTQARGALDRLIRSYLLTVFLVVLAIVALTSVVIAPVLLAFFPLGGFASLALELLRLGLALWAAMAGIAVIYRFGPGRGADARPFRLSAGVITATCLWIAGSLAFSAYLRNFGAYNEIYGSFGAVIALIMWFYLSAYAVLFGALLDAELTSGSRPSSVKSQAS